MAKISGNAATSVFQIKKWLGVNEHADGDTRLKMGEAAEMHNWRITDGGSLQIRPGTKTMLDFDAPIRGMWSGYVKGEQIMVCASGGRVWIIDPLNAEKRDIGAINDAHTEFFGYSEKLYMLNGTQYKAWDGETLSDVEGYRPLVVTAAVPTGGGTLLEPTNKLTGAKRVRFSPDGTAKEFVLPEKDLASVDFVKNLVSGEAIDAYTTDLANGKVTFNSAPAAGTSSIEIGYTAKTSDRATVCAMRFAEIYNGATDNRVFLYGDGSNQTIYSDIDENGTPTAEYFPDLNVLAAGEANTPITALIRHFSRLLVFKSNSTYSVQYSTMTLSDGAVTAGFYLTPVNRNIGNAAFGQVRLVENNPRSLHGKALYEWKSSNGYLTADERQAKHISERISTSLSAFDMARVYAFDDDLNQEYYLVYNGKALVHNYRQDAWYIYTQFPAVCMVSHDGELYYGTEDGDIRHVSREYRNDNLQNIDAFWRSGSLAFDADWRRKYSSVIWVAMMPELGARVTVTARSNVKSDYPEKVVSYGFATFSRVDFKHFSFNTNRQATVQRVRLKVKKATYYQLVFESNSASATATIVGTDIQVRYSGNVK